MAIDESPKAVSAAIRKLIDDIQNDRVCIHPTNRTELIKCPPGGPIGGYVQCNDCGHRVEIDAMTWHQGNFDFRHYWEHRDERIRSGMIKITAKPAPKPRGLTDLIGGIVSRYFRHIGGKN